jgi:hypothetical protein
VTRELASEDQLKVWLHEERKAERSHAHGHGNHRLLDLQ